MSKFQMRFKSLVAVAFTLLLVHGAAFALKSTEPNRASVGKSHHKSSHRRRVPWNPMFRPSHDSLLRQNEEIDRIELPRIQDDDELEALKASHALVPIVASESLKIEHRLDPARRYCRPWTRDFVEDLGQAYYKQFHEQIQVNSAVRTVMVQKKLRRHNRNAAPAEGDTASSHLAGVTVDLQRRGMSKEQIRFVERYLFYLRELRLVEPEEERRHWCFHVMVSDRYADWRQSQTVFPRLPAIDTETAVTGSN
ncbi:MAG TPA: DUF5715 family protein [Terriglobales bacterium]|jgi:hypothetical protein|nr:DUF5715 family protein [Terriglobales bacterium]